MIQHLAALSSLKSWMDTTCMQKKNLSTGQLNIDQRHPLHFVSFPRQSVIKLPLMFVISRNKLLTFKR